MRTAALLIVLATGRLATGYAAAQGSPFVPISDPATALTEHLIARGVLADPSPMTRPFDRTALVRALMAVDTTALSRGERRAVRAALADLDVRERGAFGRLDGHVGLAAATYPERDPLELDRGVPVRRPGKSRAFASGGLNLTLLYGPVTIVTHPYFDTRLKYDPDYEGKKDRIIAGRNAEAYVRAVWRYGEVFFGSVDRNWGPPAAQSLLVSPAPYSYDHFAVTIGTPSFHIEGLLTQLDDLNDTTGTANHRYFVAHRLVIRPPGRTALVLWEGNVLAGPARQLEPWYANIFTLGLLQQYDQNSRTNSLLGFDLQTRVAGVTASGSFLLDDIQIDKKTAADREPPSYGFTLGAEGGVGRAGWSAFYTRVVNLTYRTPSPPEAVMRSGVGLGRNFADYDQLTVRGSWYAAPGVLLSPEATLLRQGAGDFRLPYPPVAAYDTTPTFLAGVVQRTLRLAAAAELARPRYSVSAEAGVHLVRNAGHVTGASESRFVGRIGVTWRFRKESVLP